MSNNGLDENCFSTGDDDKKNLRVHLINPPIDEPWRTRQDYIDDRKQMENSFQRTVEAHELLKKSYRNNNIALIIAFSVMIATLLSAFVTFDTYLTKKLENEVTQK
jgi:hypothetical protein